MFSPGTAGTPTSRVELFIKGRGLLDLDVLSKSDPQVHVFQRDVRTGKWLELGRTEQINDNLNPVFTKSIQLDYRFEEVQQLRFVCVDIDRPGAAMDQQELIGTFECQLGEIVGSQGGKISRALTNPKYPGRQCGSLSVSVEEVSDVRHQVVLEFYAKNLDKKDWFGKSDPFLRISRAKEGGTYDAVYKTEVIKNDLNPRWRRFQVPMQKLCNGDPHRPLLIECIDWNASGKESPIGQCQTSLDELQKQVSSRTGLALKLPAKAGKKGYNNSGMLYIAHGQLVVQPTFLDYIRGGMEINLVIGIDFTASNGNPSDTSSLHYMGRSQANEYERAIRSVASVLANYDTDGFYPVYGFGARLPPSGMVSHCFPLNGDFNNPGVRGVDGVLAAYFHTLQNVQLYGPTNFAQLIEAAAREASKSSNGKAYTILLILTDGVISDLDNTIDQIVAASTLPLSIVIVGVGNADFKNMEALDADVRPLVDRRGRKMARDIVQFVPMRDYANAHPGRIAEVTLEEIPGQIVGYMQANQIKPRPALARADTVAAPATAAPGLAHMPTGGVGAAPYPPTAGGLAHMPSSGVGAAPYPGYPPTGAPYPTNPPYPTANPPYPPTYPTNPPYPTINPPYPTNPPY